MRLPRPVPAVSAAILVVLLASGLTGAAIPAAAAALLLALAGVSAWRPDRALLLVAAALPVSTWIGRMWSPGFMWPEALVVAFGAGYFASAAVRERRASDLPLLTAILTLAAIVVASLAVQLAVVDERLGARAFGDELWRSVARDFFVPHRAGPALSASVLLLEGLILLYATADICRSRPGFSVRVMQAVVAGATAAAAVTLWLIVSPSFRSPTPLAAFGNYLATLRLSATFSDVNAAGSFFIMALAVAVALALRGHAAVWIAAAVVVAAGLWMSGSRTALIAGALSLGVPLAALLRNRIRTAGALRAAIAATTVVGIVAVALWLPERGAQPSPAMALRIRTELLRTGLRMFASEPVSGIGIGEFYQRSGEFSSPELIAIFPVARNENAHNYLLQVLAELGLLGLGAFLWIMAVAARNTRSALRSSRADRLLWGVAAGLVAFGVTCLAGHPLLVPEVAGPFWILLGIAAGSGSPIEIRDQARKIYRLGLAAVVAILIATLPLRAQRQIAATNLEHVGIDLSGWRWSEDGTRYREAGRTCSVFVPAHAGWVAIPLRAATPGAMLDVEVRLDGRLVNIVRVPSDGWYSLRLVVPAESGGPKFKRVDLRVPASQEASVVLLVGKVHAPR
jgi:O-antigen ligase